MIRTLVAASSPAARSELEARLAAGAAIAIVGSVSALEALADEVEANEPQVVVLALDGDPARATPSAVMDGLHLAPDAAHRAPALVLLLDDPTPAWAADAVRDGARAVLPRDASPAELIAAIEAAAAGLVTVPADLAVRLLAATPRARVAARAPGTPMHPLTAREVEVLASLAEGLANKQIAARLGISEHTVKTHVASILAKLDAGSRAEAVAIGARTGMIFL